MAKKSQPEKSAPPKWTALVKDATGLTAEVMAEQLGVDASMLRRWCAPSGGEPSAESQRAIRRRFPRESALADQQLNGAAVSDPSATSSGTPAVKGTHGQDLLELELAGREGVISEPLYVVLKDTIGNLRGTATSAEGARKTIDGLIAVYTAGLHRRSAR